MKSLTPAQSAAINARGDVLLEAGAGAGKTSTLVARCLAQVFAAADPVSVDEILMVTFTEAAAAEMRRRIREALNARVAADPADERLAEQLALLDQARIGTLHSFCFRLVRDHFQDLGLDPQTQVLDDGEARLLATETASALLDRYFEGDQVEARPILELVRQYGAGESEAIESLVIAMHHHLQTLPDPEHWLERESRAWERYDQSAWEAALAAEFQAARQDWQELLAAQPADNVVAHDCCRRLAAAGNAPTRSDIASLCVALAGFRGEEHWNRNKGRHRDPILSVLDEAAALAAFAVMAADGTDPLEADFLFMRPHMLALLKLVREFGQEFSARKRQRAGLDFSDLEQFSLRLLWDAADERPTAIARRWRELLKAVFVDEYQDINEAQDRIITAISREGVAGNRFLVGDVKQSIYGFRLARPDIFLRYARTWRKPGGSAQVLPLNDNFRSHEAILEFVNQCFAVLLREDLGGIGYPADAQLKFGDRAGRPSFAKVPDSRPRVQFDLRFTASRRAPRDGDETDETDGDQELTNAELEAVVTANRLRQLHEAGTLVHDPVQRSLRPVRWSDMAILLRATTGKAEVFAQAFARAGIPLVADQRGFFDALEIADFLNLFLLLDNPQQDIPLLAVLRSPLVGLTPDELALIRVAAPRERLFWTALKRHQELAMTAPTLASQKVKRFLEAFGGWRDQVRRGSLSQCLEDVLDATHYLDWLATQPRSEQRAGNVQRLLELTRHYDAWQGRGLHRFLNYVRLLDADGHGPEPAAPPGREAVRLMTIHASKGLEFPIVVLAGLSRSFQSNDSAAGVILDDELGVCPEVFPVERRLHYPSVSWLRARRRQRQRTTAEEIRLLYVAMTRACDHLVLVGTATESRAREHWVGKPDGTLSRTHVMQARSPLELLGPLLSVLTGQGDWMTRNEGEGTLLGWRIYGSDEAIDLAVSAPSPATVPEDGPTASQMADICQRVGTPYPFLRATLQAGKTTVTRIRRQWNELEDREAKEMFPTVDQADRRRTSTTLSAAEVGIAHHTLFQKLALDSVQTLDRLAGEADRLARSGELTARERDALQLDQVLAFWTGPVGRAVLDRQASIHRELEFTCSFPAGELSALAGTGETQLAGDDLVVVQGIVDLAVIDADKIWIVDYKTDQLPWTAVADRVQRYRPQVELYRRALTRVFSRPVTRVWLHFLSPGITVEVDDAGPAGRPG